MASIGEVDEKDVLNPHDLEDLYSWIDAAPLSRPKKNIARDFSDGVSVAEIVHFYMPRLVELHNYVNANSTSQKRINWNMINRKIFAKLNVKLSDKIVENVIEAKPGAIEQVLWDLRRKMIEVNPRSVTKQLSRSTTPLQLRSKSPAKGYSEGKVGKKASGLPQSSRIPTKSPDSVSNMLAASSKKIAAVLPSLVPSKGVPQDKIPDGISYSAGLKDELTQYGNNVTSSDTVDPGSSKPNASSSGGADLNANNDPSSLPPAHLIYKGHKMVPSMLLDIKNKQIRDLEAVVNSLQKKVNFLDNLIQLKDSRVEDLTRQLHTLRSKFQELTQTHLPEL